MPRGRHRVEPVKRPLPRPLAAGAVAAALVVLPLGIAAWQSNGAGEQAQALQPVVAGSGSSVPASGETDADELAAALQVRERVQASRGDVRSEAAATAGTAPSAAAPAPQPSVLPEQPPAPVAEPEPVPAAVGQLWAKSDVNVRSGPSTGHERIGSVAAVTQVDVTGAVENGWTQVLTDGRAGWVNSYYLSESKPEPPAEPVAAALSGASCPLNSDIEPNLTANARAVYRAVCAAFGGSVSAFGGYRPGDSGDHGSGRAVDIMVSGEPGWEIARYVQAHAAELGVSYVIYQQRIWQAGDSASRWDPMSDRGGATANHYDHVHVSVS